MRRLTMADGLLLTTVLLWALNFTVSKYLLDQGLAPLPYSSLRYAAAGAIFVALALATERSIRIARRDAPLVTLAWVLLVLNQVSFVLAIHYTTASTVALIFGTLPIFTALIAHLTGERQHARFWIGALVSFAGVALVAIGSGGGLSGDLTGDLLSLAGAATWAGYAVVIAPLMRSYTPVRLSAVLIPAATVPLALLALPKLADQQLHFGALFWAGFAFAVLGPLVITNITWFTAIDKVGPSHASLFANLQPFLAAIAAVVLLSEHITLIQVAGGVAIAAGILVSGRARPAESARPVTVAQAAAAERAA